MERRSVPPFEVEVQRVDGVGLAREDEESFEFRVLDETDSPRLFAIFGREGAARDEASISIADQAAIPLTVVVWAIEYAKKHL